GRKNGDFWWRRVDWYRLKSVARTYFGCLIFSKISRFVLAILASFWRLCLLMKVLGQSEYFLHIYANVKIAKF
ncbi:MAG: hypothetical protein II200_07215, partial [Bacteroidaceae bacterium]|nr:hypothetical protein [Bacteroidaceae bacterium]